MVVDAFIFYNEFDLLEVRLEELYSVVDKFVIVESNHKLSGHIKPLFFLENQHKYSKYLDKIIRVTCPDLHVSENTLDTTQSFENEINQREFIFEVIKDFPEDSIIMISDLDEMPSRQSIELLKNSSLPVAFAHDFFYYDYTSYKGKWTGTKAFLKSTIVSKNQIQGTRNALTVDRAISQGYKVIDAGWHLSYFFDLDGIETKIKSFAHQEFNSDTVISKIKQAVFEKKDLFDRAWERIIYKPYGEHLPELIKDRVKNSYLDDAVIGIATHRKNHLDRLLASMQDWKYQKIITVQPKRVAANLSDVWNLCKSTGKRYVVLMDDDIEVLEQDAIYRGIQILQMTGWAICSTHETYNSNYELGKHLFMVYEKEWLPGYFLIIDTHKIGDYVFDTTLNEDQDHVDLDMCMYAHSLGYRVGNIDRVIVHHSDNHFPEHLNRGLDQYNMAHGNLRRKWSIESTLVPDKSVYEATYIKHKNVYSTLT
jgi:beta-1,4-mannosyl-glycoprotein beta-1,4-N-acetylglucosaminyltransferase